MTKEKAYNDFFNDNDDDYDDDRESGGKGRILVIVLFVLLLFLTGFLTFKLATTSSELEKTKAAASSYATLEESYNSLKLEKLALDDEIAQLQAENTTLAAKVDELEAGTQAPAGTVTPTNPTGATTGGSEHTVVDGDSFWSIAVKYYNDGSKYSKILEANNMKETDSLKIGQKLKIPNL